MGLGSLKGTLMQIWKSANTSLSLCENNRFHIKTHYTFWDIRTWDMWNVCLQTLGNNKMLKISLLF